MTSEAPRSFYKRSPARDNDEPFAGDVIGDRAEIAKRLTTCVDGFTDGCVFAIDGPWGSGKTWFGKSWQRSLEAQDHRVARLDAFGSDYAEDPYVLIASCIGNLAKSGESQLKDELKRSAVAVGRALLPGLGKAALTIIVEKTVGSNAAEHLKDAIKGARDDEGDAIEQYVKDKFDRHDRQSQAVETFRTSLTAFTKIQSKPVVFIIDELDRCRPDFAVRLVERIKHFFDVPNLVFVLLLNRSQLEAAIRGIYGQSIDANAYLSKFIQFFVTLSTPATSGEQGIGFAKAYCNELEKRYSHPNNDKTRCFVNNLAALAPIFNLTFRDLERGFILFGIADVQSPGRMALLAYLIALKLRDPDLFHQIAAGDEAAHTAAIGTLAAALTGNTEVQYLTALINMHKYRNNTNTQLSPEARTDIRNLVGDGEPSQTINATIARLAKKIDLLVSN